MVKNRDAISIKTSPLKMDEKTHISSLKVTWLRPLKMDGWKMMTFLLGYLYRLFSEGIVSFREGNFT